MDRDQIIKYRDNLHWEIVRHVTRLTRDNQDFDITLDRVLCTTAPSGYPVQVYGIDGETCRLITGKSDGFNIDYPRLTTPQLEELHSMILQKEYSLISLT